MLGFGPLDRLLNNRKWIAIWRQLGDYFSPGRPRLRLTRQLGSAISPISCHFRARTRVEQAMPADLPATWAFPFDVRFGSWPRDNALDEVSAALDHSVAPRC